MAFSGANFTVDTSQLDGAGQIRGMISGVFEGWTNLQLFVTFVLLCATYDQGTCPYIALSQPLIW